MHTTPQEVLRTVTATTALSDAFEEENLIEPPFTTNRDVFFRTAAGLIGGLTGTLVLIISFIAVAALFRGLDLETSTNPILLFALLLSVFFTALSSNIAAAALIFLFNRDKYKKLFGTLAQIFWLNVIIFVFMIPVYLFVNNSGMYTIIYPMALHLLLGAFLSAVTQEIISNYRYFMIGMYGLTVGMLVVLVLGLGVAFGATAGDDGIRLLFGGLVILFPPLIWGSMMFCATMGEMVYHFLYTTFGMDFLGNITFEEIEEDGLDEDTEETDSTL